MKPEDEVRPAELPAEQIVINGRTYVPQYRPDPKYYCKGCALADPVLGGNDDCMHEDAKYVMCWMHDPKTGLYNFQWREILTEEQ